MENRKHRSMSGESEETKENKKLWRRLDEEAEKSGKRVQEWKVLKREQEESEREKLGQENPTEPKSGKAWTLEGESGDEEAWKPEVDVDPLDAYMESIVLPELERLKKAVDDTSNGKNDGQQTSKGLTMGRIFQGEDDSESDYEESNEGTVEGFIMERKKKVILSVDHKHIQPFRKMFLTMSTMTDEEVAAYKNQAELKIFGKDVPKPVQNWPQSGLATKVLENIKKMHFGRPVPFKAQAIPVLMSGRDCFGIAKIGCGKTIAYLLPMLRHVKAQKRLVSASGDGPIGLVMAPTRELVQQIYNEIKKFSKATGLSCVPVHGGTGVSKQISALKLGTDIVVCTPGRLIDVLCISGGKVTNLDRVTYLVIDDADHMVDMGFEPQITQIVQSTRPGRESTISDFKRNVCNLLVATSIPARGLDVKGLELVVNFDVANHYAEYVHRVGRTVPDDLRALAVGFKEKVEQGIEQAYGTCYGGGGSNFWSVCTSN